MVLENNFHLKLKLDPTLIVEPLDVLFNDLVCLFGLELNSSDLFLFVLCDLFPAAALARLSLRVLKLGNERKVVSGTCPWRPEVGLTRDIPIAKRPSPRR